MDDIEAIKSLKQLLLRLEEAEDPNLEPASMPDDDNTAPESGSDDQSQVDQEIEDVMTEPKIDDDKTLDIVLDDMEITNGDDFRNAFLQLKAGIAPTNDAEIKAFSDAFVKLMQDDASSTQRNINRLRDAMK